MQPIPSTTLKYINSFSVKGLSVRTQNSDEFNENTAKISTLWQQFYTSDLITPNAHIFGVYSDYDADEDGFYTVTAGVTSSEPQPQLNTATVQTGNYLVFQGKGPMPLTVVETWKQVWKYFEETNEYQRHFISDFEAYISPDEVAIYIGVK
ncbi:MAG: GyrI-like domain-containing protein [Gammaproteobacteria bacterium]|nr:GyrI-like domain-containing protein [Gammaproteobacteria bacterium]